MPYEPVVFIQGYEAEEPLAIMREEGLTELLRYLAQWENGDDIPSQESSGAGTSDDTYVMDLGGFPYLLTVNRAIGYCGLARIVD